MRSQAAIDRMFDRVFAKLGADVEILHAAGERSICKMLFDEGAEELSAGFDSANQTVIPTVIGRLKLADAIPAVAGDMVNRSLDSGQTLVYVIADVEPVVEGMIPIVLRQELY